MNTINIYSVVTWLLRFI